MNVRFLSCGDTAFSVEFGNEIAPEINARVMALHTAILGANILGIIESVPTIRALMIYYDPLITCRAEVQAQIETLVSAGGTADSATRRVTIPCCYDGQEFAPDLAEVAERTGKTPEQVIIAHLTSPFKVYVIGSMPGLAYIAGLTSSLYLPRRSQPRVRVPRSSVAIAMGMTTIYPFESPGGWHIIGRTPLSMFDQRREQPVFLAPGDTTIFERIDRKTYDRIEREVERGTFDWSELVRP